MASGGVKDASASEVRKIQDNTVINARNPDEVSSSL